MFLTQDEIQELTHKKTRTAQIRALTEMGIEHIVRPDGTALVLKEHVEERLGVRASADKKRKSEPNWSAIA